MIIYLDITQLEKGRVNTGIQRVVKEFISRASICGSIEYKIFIFKEKEDLVYILDNNEIDSFLRNIQTYEFKSKQEFDLLNFKPSEITALFDIDASWNVDFKRDKLYPILKENNFLIFNFIYDMIPILFKDLAHDLTVQNFGVFIDSVYKYSDLVMFDSQSAQDDFLKIKKDRGFNREISTRSIGLGSDFLEVQIEPVEKSIANILTKKYLLFVGTLEPRKNQEDVLNAFEVLSKKYDDLNLVIIGKKGWKIDHLAYRLDKHKLKNKKIFWLQNIDDNTLKQFYQNAFIVTYLSKYEGYGLPIAESLGYGNITIASKNSSMYEVGFDFADYVEYNSLNELVEIISLYSDNQDLYNLKKEYIKNNFLQPVWSKFYDSIYNIFLNFEKSINLRSNHLSKFQFVFISIDKHNLEGTIKAIDKYIDFVKEYIIITAPKFIEDFDKIESKYEIKVINELDILKEYSEGFAQKDHQSKNWLLRASLLNVESLDNEFIMLDDDNQPLKNIKISDFINEDGKYNAYFFYNLLYWHNKFSEYDIGQQMMKGVLSEQNYELLSYSSHAPQIINKTIFKEVVDKFFDIGLKKPIDEWSTYFNYANSIYPYLFNKKVFATLNWPATPFQWDYHYSQNDILFENYYLETYQNRVFNEDTSYEEKVKLKKEQLRAFEKSRTIFDENRKILSSNNMVHGICRFETEEVQFYLSNIPYFIILEKDSDYKLRLNYKLINKLNKNLDISVVLFLDGNYRILRCINDLNSDIYQESIIEIPITSINLEENMYDISFNIMINGKYLYDISPYYLKLIIIKDKDYLEVLGNPQMLNVEDNKKISLKSNIKTKLKNIPILGDFLRWLKTIVKINKLNQQVVQLNQQVQKQQQEIEELKNINNSLNYKISKSIAFETDSMQQRIDQFIFDAKVDLKLKDDN
jgi:glycosyltransferase involved in cell wall biosynthesis